MSSYEDLQLWNEQVKPQNYETEEKYRAAVLEQYKIYVDLTDKAQARAPIIDTFFLTINGAALTLIGAFASKGHGIAEAQWWLVIPLIAMISNCYIWWRSIHSRKFINAAKYRVIGELESRLPASPLWRAEWHALVNYGRASKRFIGPVQEWIPVIFGFVYIGGFIAILLA